MSGLRGLISFLKAYHDCEGVEVAGQSSGDGVSAEVLERLKHYEITQGSKCGRYGVSLECRGLMALLTFTSDLGVNGRAVGCQLSRTHQYHSWHTSTGLYATTAVMDHDMSVVY